MAYPSCTERDLGSQGKLGLVEGIPTKIFPIEPLHSRFSRQGRDMS